MFSLHTLSNKTIPLDPQRISNPPKSGDGSKTSEKCMEIGGDARALASRVDEKNLCGLFLFLGIAQSKD